MGLLTGYIGGRRARQEETTRELTNIKSQYEFQEYVGNRGYRDLTKGAQASKDRITVETAPSRLKKTRAENIAGTATAKITSNSYESELAKTIAVNEKNAAAAVIGLEQDQTDALAQIFGAGGEAWDEKNNVDDQTYNVMYEQAEGLFGQEELDSLGITKENNPKAQSAMLAVRRQAIHRVKTQIDEHLFNLKQKWAVDLAVAKATGQSAESILGKMMQDRDMFQSQADNTAPGTSPNTIAQSSVDYMNSAILSYTGEKAAVTQEKVQSNFDKMLAKTFPTYTSDLESDIKDTAQASIFINNVFNTLTGIYSPQKTQEIIAKMYKYDSNSWNPNGFSLKDDLDSISTLADFHTQVQEVDAVLQKFAGLVSLGPDAIEQLVIALQEQARQDASASFTPPPSAYTRFVKQ